MDRLLLTLATLLVVVLGSALMLRGWRHRQGRQAHIVVPPVAIGAARELLGPIEGLYVGTTRADDWLDRIVVHHLCDRAAGELTVETDGVHVLRDDLPDVFVPLDAIREISVEQSLAGKVVSTGMLVITWQLGDLEVATGFRSDDPADNQRLRTALTALILETTNLTAANLTATNLNAITLKTTLETT